jgi:hypothetical protein
LTGGGHAQAKVKVFMDYNQIKYTPVEVNPLSKAEVMSHGFTKVPQLRLGTPNGNADDNGNDAPILVDSQEIVNILAPLVMPERAGKAIDPDEVQWREWCGSTLVRLLVVNTNRTIAEANQGYEYVDQVRHQLH